MSKGKNTAKKAFFTSLTWFYYIIHLKTGKTEQNQKKLKKKKKIMGSKCSGKGRIKNKMIPKN